MVNSNVVTYDSNSYRRTHHPFIWEELVPGCGDKVTVSIDSNLVDSASSIRLSQRLSHACLSISDYTVKLRMAHYISYSLFDGLYYLDNRSNSRANTCINPRLTKGCIY